MPKIEFIREEENSPEKLFIDGRKIKDFKFYPPADDCDEDCTLVFETTEMPGFCGAYYGKVWLSFTPSTVREACIVLKDELEKSNSPVRAAFKASIKSAIDEAPNYTNMNKLAERILERIIGEK